MMWSHDQSWYSREWSLQERWALAETFLAATACISSDMQLTRYMSPLMKVVVANAHTSDLLQMNHVRSICIQSKGCKWVEKTLTFSSRGVAANTHASPLMPIYH